MIKIQMFILVTILSLFSDNIRINAQPMDLDETLGEIVMNLVETHEKVEAFVEILQKMYSEQLNELEPNIWTKFDQLNTALHEKQNYQRQILQLLGELKNLRTTNGINTTINGGETSQNDETYYSTNDPGNEISEKKKQVETERNKWRREFWKNKVEMARNLKNGVSEQVTNNSNAIRMLSQNYANKDVVTQKTKSEIEEIERGQKKVAKNYQRDVAETESENYQNDTEINQQNNVAGNYQNQKEVENDEIKQKKLAENDLNDSEFELNNLCGNNDQLRVEKKAENDQNEIAENVTADQKSYQNEIEVNNVTADQNNELNEIAEKVAAGQNKSEQKNVKESDQNNGAEDDKIKVSGSNEIKSQKNATQYQNKTKNKQLAVHQQHLTPVKILKRGETLDNHNFESMEKNKNKVEDVENVDKRDEFSEKVEQKLNEEVSEISMSNVTNGNKNCANRNKYNVMSSKTRLEPISEVEEECISENVTERPMIAKSSILENVSEVPVVPKHIASKLNPNAAPFSISENVEERSMLLNHSSQENVSQSENVTELPVVAKPVSSKLNQNAAPYIFGIKNAMEN